jgi:hypothetical protein
MSGSSETSFHTVALSHQRWRRLQNCDLLLPKKWALSVFKFWGGKCRNVWIRYPSSLRRIDFCLPIICLHGIGLLRFCMNTWLRFRDRVSVPLRFRDEFESVYFFVFSSGVMDKDPRFLTCFFLSFLLSLINFCSISVSTTWCLLASRTTQISLIERF